MQHLKIFKVEQHADTLVVIPHGEGSAFRYQNLHLEANSIRGMLTGLNIRNIVIDLSEIEYFGSEFIGSLVSLLRETRTRKGKAAFCCASPQMMQVLSNMSLFKLWPHCESREAALKQVSTDPQP
ncbi:STAS domain-containing protein [Planctomicrobium sp. SH668]|uniref:STAS domain-containing protein n=1 Tax=Planctomicrobium sp. SH668 TaxID=3448126 RepID=UPI003F5C7E1E